MYGSLNFGAINMTQVTNYMADIWSMFSNVIYMVLGIAAIAALLSMVLSAVIKGLRGG